MAVTRVRPDEDQRLWSTMDGRLHRIRDPTIPAVLLPTNRAGQLSTTWRLWNLGPEDARSELL